MTRKKKFNNQAGFLWNTVDIERVATIAASRDLTPSDIYREAMRLYLDVQDGKVTLTFLAQPAQPTPPEEVTGNFPVTPLTKVEVATPEGDTANLSPA